MRQSAVLKWSKEVDVVVAGYGYAGAVSAISAHDFGARVVILEKMSHPGGCSVLSGGAVNYAEDAEEAVKYLTVTQGGRCGEDLIRAMAQGLKEIPAYMEELAKVDKAKLLRQPGRAGTYPFPGTQTLGRLFVQEIPSFDGFPWFFGRRKAGERLLKLLIDNVESRQIEVMLSTPVKELVSSNGEVVGVVAASLGKELAIKARRAVILATGGFEFNEKLKKDSFEAIPVYSMGNPGNTGDGILMAQKVGASLWHMWHFHGSYGFKFPEFPTAFRTILGGPRNPERKIAWINVDKFGKRFMNEYHPAPQDTMHRPLEHLDPDIQDYPRIPCYLIFDEVGRRMEPIADPMTGTEEHQYEWSRDNSKEVERGWIVKADTLKELGKRLGIPPDNLEESVARWNASCERGWDAEFARPPGTMMPIKTPPFYAIQAWPICTNTQGGPEHNAQQQVLDPYGKPIPRLYATGELGSFYGHLYLLGGNISECLIGGRIAGMMAASEHPWD